MPDRTSSRSLSGKLGLAPGMKVKLIGAPAEYLSWIDHYTSLVYTDTPPFDFVHLFVNEIEVLEDTLVILRKQIAQNGMVWVSWYKRTSGFPSQLTEDIIRETCLPLGFVDIKVCAVSDQWSGLKLVIRKSERNK